MTTDDPRAECRRILAANTLDPDHLDIEIEAFTRDRNLQTELFRVVLRALHVQRAWKALDPTWCHDRDEAIDGLVRACRELERVLRRAPIVGDISRYWLEDLDRAVDALRRGTGHGLSYLQLNRATVFGEKGQPRRGHPGHPWLADADAAMSKLGVPRDRRRAILAAAGLRGRNDSCEVDGASAVRTSTRRSRARRVTPAAPRICRNS